MPAAATHRHHNRESHFDQCRAVEHADGDRYQLDECSDRGQRGFEQLSAGCDRGTQSVSPTATTIYTAIATGQNNQTATASATVAISSGGGSLNSINHVFFMQQENRTFDTYFGMLNPYRHPLGLNIGDDGKDSEVDGIDDKLSTISNTDDEGDVYPLFKFRTACVDDETSAWLESYGDVNRYDFLPSRQILMDGFVHTAEASRSAAPLSYFSVSPVLRGYTMNSWFSRLLCFLAISVVLVGFVACGGNSSNTTSPSPIPTVTITLNNSSIIAGQSVTLTWTSTNATSITITPSVGQSPLPLSGSVSLSPTANTTYTAVATGAGGNAQESVTVAVTASASGLPSVSFTATPASVMVGSIVTFSWSTTDATTFGVKPTIQAEDDIGMALSGTTTIVANSTQTYVATAIGPGGTVTQSVTVTVTGPAPTFTTLTATPPSISAGQSSTLQWSTSNAQYVTISGISQQFQPSDQVSVSPIATTTYTATATGPDETATQTVAVNVNPISITLSAAPATIAPGGSSTLTWTSVGAISVTINGVSGMQSPNGSVAVTPAQTTTFTATASDGNGNAALSAATVTVVTGTGDLSAIKHIIFMMQENRSFDDYFGKLGAYRAAKVSGASPSDVDDLDQLPTALANGIQTRTDAPHPGMLIPPFHERTLQTEDLSPSWNESHYDAHLVGMDYMNVTSSSVFEMDYFLQTTHSVSPDLYDPDGTRPMGYYDQTDLPYYYELATQFAISDQFHSSLLSQTNPNRMYLFAATSLGRCNADSTGHAPWQTTTIFDELLNAGVSWRYYYQDGVFLAQFADWSNPKIQTNVYNLTNMFTLLSQPNADSQLPEVIFIERGTKTDEHPDNNIQAGATVVKSVLDALMASSAWKDSIFIFTYDEGGGLFDHVPPFMVTPPGDMGPNCTSNLTPGLYNLSGFRVPLIVISPYSKPHYVSHTPMENTSILKLIETRFNLPPLTQRDANAPDMTEFFDFTNPYWLTPPSLPAQPNECLTNSSRCNQKLETYPNLP